MGFAEDKFSDFLRRNPNLLTRINVDDMLNQLRAVFTLSVAEQLERDLDRRGNLRTVHNFLAELRRRDDWVNNFLRALWECEHRELFETLKAEYKSYRPQKTVWEPPSDSYSSLPNNLNVLPQPDNPPPYASLPLELYPRMPQHQPGPPVAPSPSRVQQEETPRLGHQPQENRDPSNVSRAPTSQRHPPAPDSTHCVSLPDLVDIRELGDDLSKKPVPESSLESYRFLSEGINPSERDSSEQFFLPAKENTTTLENQEVARPVEQGASLVNSPGKYSADEPSRTSVYPKVAERDAPSPPNFYASSIHSVNNVSMAPPQRELTNYTQGAPNSTASQFSDASDTSQRHRVESLPNPGAPNSTASQFSDASDTSQHRQVESLPNPVTSPPPQHVPAVTTGSVTYAVAGQQHREQSTYQPVTSPPSQHVPAVSSGSGAYAGAVQQRREQSTYQPNEHRSSCRPTDYDNWALGKPEVLMSTPCEAAPGEASECSPLSRIPELEISLDESSNGHAQSSGSSQSPATRTSMGSPSSQREATTSTPNKANSWSSSKRSPEENEEPRGSPSSMNRTMNVSLSQEPEENSFEISRDLDSYRINFNEEPSVDLMADNNVLRHRTMNSSGTNNASDKERERFHEEECSTNSNLHNPLVITLGAAVVCLSLYIIWLKHKN